MEMKRIDRAAFWGIPALFLLAAVFHFSVRLERAKPIEHEILAMMPCIS